MTNKGVKGFWGDWGEDLVVRLLSGKGLSILETKFRSIHGEIDVIAKDFEYVVFIEVKYRRSRNFGLPKESVGKSKQAKIIKTALHYIEENQLVNTDFRFDVIEIYGYDSMRIEHIENAFIT